MLIVNIFQFRFLQNHIASTIGVVILLAGLGATYIGIKGVPSYKSDIPSEIAGLQVPRDSVHVAQGAKIATLLCNECHKDHETGKLMGNIMPDLPKAVIPATQPILKQ